MTFNGKSACGLVSDLFWFYSWSKALLDLLVLFHVVKKAEEVANHAK